MDAKSKANFINSVASGEGIPCPNCGAKNKSDSSFCITCGTKLTMPETSTQKAEQSVAPAFAQVNEAKAEPVVVSTYKEPESVFAQGLPSWSVEPPQVMVRRHR